MTGVLTFFWDSLSESTVTGSCFPVPQSPVPSYTMGWVNRDHSWLSFIPTMGQASLRYMVSPMGSLHSGRRQRRTKYTYTHKNMILYSYQSFGKHRVSN